MRRDSRKIPKLWVINALANPRPTLETYSYAMPGEANTPQAQLEIFDVASKAKVLAKVDAFKDQTMQIEVDRPGAAASASTRRPKPLWAGPGSDKLYFNRLSRDMKRLDVCVADTATGEVKPLIQERMNVYIESKPLKVINNGTELVFWSERDGWGHYYLYGADGTLKNQITHGEFVAEDISYIDEKSREMFLTASGREDGEDPYFMHFYRVKLDGSGMKMLDPGRCLARRQHERFRPLFRRYLLQGQHRAEERPAGCRRRRRDASRDRRPHRRHAGRIPLSRTVQGQGRRWHHRSLRRDVQAVRFRPCEEISDHRVRVSRAAAGERDQDVHQGAATRCSWPISASS